MTKNSKPTKKATSSGKKPSAESKKPAPAKKKPGAIGKYYGGAEGWKGVKTKPAKQLVNSQIKQEIEPLKDDKRQLKSDNRSAVRGINQIYGTTGDYLAGRNQDISSGYDQAASQNSIAQQALQNQLSKQTAGTMAEASSELSRLAIGDTGALPSLQSGGQNALNVASQISANDSA